MKIIVTGSKGFIGFHLLNHLEQLGHETFGLDIDNCDLCNFSKLVSIVKKIEPDAIFHLAAQLPIASDEAHEKFFRSNIQATFNLLESAREIKVRKFIYASTMNVYGKTRCLPVDERHTTEPVNIYGLTKLLSENLFNFYAQNLGYRVIVLRFSGVFGPGRNSGAIASFVSKALKGETIKVDSDGSDAWDTLYVKDVIAAYIAALEKINDFKYEVFNIGYGKGLVVKEAAEEIVRLTGSISKIKFADKKDKINFYYDIKKASQILNFTPSSFTESLKDFIGYKKTETGVMYK